MCCGRQQRPFTRDWSEAMLSVQSVLRVDMRRRGSPDACKGRPACLRTLKTARAGTPEA